MASNGALVGFGRVAEAAHAPALAERPGLQIAAVAEGNPARREAAARVFPHARLYESIEDLLEAERALDFAVIATPPFLHGAQALACLSAGLSVLCEKPLAFDLAELEALRARAREEGRALFTVHNWACAPQWRTIFALAADGAVGDIVEVSLEVLRMRPAAGALAGDWRMDPRLAGGGILIDHGWHALYLLYSLLGEDCASPRVEAWEQRAGSCEEEVALSLRYPKATARLRLSWRAATRENTALIRGTRGTIELRDDRVVVSAESRPARVLSFLEKLSAASAHPAWLAALLPEFEAALKDPSRADRNLKEASFCCRVIAAAYKTAPVPA